MLTAPSSVSPVAVRPPPECAPADPGRPGQGAVSRPGRHHGSVLPRLPRRPPPSQPRRHGAAHPHPFGRSRRPRRAGGRALRAAGERRPDHHRGHLPEPRVAGAIPASPASSPTSRSPAGAASPTPCTPRAAASSCSSCTAAASSHPDINGGRGVVAPSAIAIDGETAHRHGKVAYPVPHALTTEEPATVREEFVARREAPSRRGLDGVEVHGANGYLLHQFLVAGVQPARRRLRRLAGGPRPLRRRGHHGRRRGHRRRPGRHPPLAEHNIQDVSRPTSPTPRPPTRPSSTASRRSGSPT